MLSGHSAAPHPRSMKTAVFDIDFASDGFAKVYIVEHKHFQSRYSEASGELARMAGCFGVPALKMFRLHVGGAYSPTICRSWWASTPTLQDTFHASRVCRRHLATQHDGV